MARVLSNKNSYSKKVRTISGSGRLNAKDNERLKGSAKLSVITLGFLSIFTLIILGFFYLYQVNDLATKGFEIRDAENRIDILEEESKKLKIKETELRSMYAIERETQDLDLVNSKEVSYLEINGSVAMK